jgi:hypothetical protein
VKKPIIFPHIPKCGGTTILKGLENSGKRVFLDYDHPPSHIEYFSNLCRDRNRDFRELDFSPFDIVYGHFPIERYDVERDQVVLLLRDPVERALSHFYYIRDVLKLTNLWAGLRVPEIHDIKSGRMGLLDFVTTSRLNSFYRSYVGLIDTRDWRLVGFTDQIEIFAERLRAEAEIDLGRLGHERANANSVKPAESDVTEIRRLLSEEIDWYRAQREIWLPEKG